MPGQDVDALGEAFSTHNFAVINADKVTGETNFTATQNLVISNIVLHEIGHMITPKGPEFDHSLGGVMAPGTVMRDGVRAWTEYPRAILREAVTRFCRGGANRRYPCAAGLCDRQGRASRPLTAEQFRYVQDRCQSCGGCNSCRAGLSLP
jgi:hypothetical protein